MPKIAIFTSITASKDTLKDRPSTKDVDQILFTDTPAIAGPSWDVRPAHNLFVSPRRNSRAPKILAHQYLPGYDVSVWIDGSIRLIAPVPMLLNSFLGDFDLAVFRHQVRDCLYEEAQAALDQRLDDPATIHHQMRAYRAAGYPDRNGLGECGVIIRRHTPRMAAFNNAWWSEYCRYSIRDQLSFNYVLREHGIQPKFLPGTIVANPGIAIRDLHLF